MVLAFRIKFLKPLERFRFRSAAGTGVPRSQEKGAPRGNLLVRVHLIIEMSKPALRHGSLNSLFQVAVYLPS